jgi:cytochrome c556
MRYGLALGCAAALIAVAACNRTEDAPPAPEPEAESAGNAGADNASARGIDIATLMHDRHERYEEIGKAMKGITAQLKSGSPSLADIREHADLIARYAPQVVSWFPPGSGPETGRRTRAKAEIWQDFETFRQRAQAFEAEAGNFHRVSRTTDVEGMRAARAELANACKNCHDRFRGPELEH